MEKGRPYQECVWLLNSLKKSNPHKSSPRQNLRLIWKFELINFSLAFETIWNITELDLILRLSDIFELKNGSFWHDFSEKFCVGVSDFRNLVYENVFVWKKYQMHKKKWNVVADRRSNVLGGLRRFAVKFCVNKHHNKLTYLRLRFCILIDVPPYQPTRVVIPQPATLSQNPIICSTVTWWRTDKITSLWHHTMCRR